MNHYGAKARDHWHKHLPGHLAQIPDQEAFFTQLGETAATEIDQIADALAQTNAARRGVSAGAGAAGNRAQDGRDASHPRDAPDRPGGPGENRSATGLTVFTPDSNGDLTPSGVVARLDANLAAIKVVKALQAEGRAATPAEQEILARWSGWGAVAAVFAENEGKNRAFAPARQQLRALLTDKEYAAARRNTINAHYTGTALAQAMWDGLAAFGFTGGRVLEPGCGSGNFIGLAPLGTAMAGVELDPVTAHVAAALYPHAQIRNESFADTQLPEGSFDAAIGNVPFGKIHLNDSRHNPGRRHPIHTHFVLKSAALVRPGGWIALITSRYTLDGTGEDAVAARRQLAGLGELAAAVRLPAAAHRRTAGTDVVTDVLVIRRFEDGEQPPPGEPAWIQTVPVDVDGVQIPVNRYFADHPGMVLGDLATGGARRADDLRVIAPAGTDVAAGLRRHWPGQPRTAQPRRRARQPRRRPWAARPRDTSKPARTAHSPGSPTGSSSPSTRPAGPPGRRNCGHCWACGTRR